jgi:hypothetical protein
MAELVVVGFDEAHEADRALIELSGSSVVMPGASPTGTAPHTGLTQDAAAPSAH